MALIFISIIWFLSEAALSRLLRSQSGTDRDQSSLRVLWITIILSIVIGISLHFSGLGQIHLMPLLFYNTGIVLIFIGLAFRWVAILTLKKSFTVNVAVSEEQTIIHTGIYKSIRHPSYLGSLLSFLGLGLAFGNWLTTVVIFLPICAAFLYRIRIEEGALRNAFPEYAEYMRQTKRLIPGVY
jgi:protein-S-isoprenylcysteine O-methyltransferase Ste14